MNVLVTPSLRFLCTTHRRLGNDIGGRHQRYELLGQFLHTPDPLDPVVYM
jgi:hypothetical protein